MPAAHQIRERTDKWDFKKLKSLCTTKKIGLLSEETTHRVGKNICQLYIRLRTDNNIQGT
jgi:hypothetical protein